jgi:hypothetical protein
MMGREDTGLYLALVRAGLGESCPEEVELDGGPAADWPWITASARRHRLGSLLFEGIRRLSFERYVPEPVWRSLESAYYTNLVHNFFLFEHAQALVKKTRRAGTPLVLLKGASFAGWLYPSPALRPMGDLDILVRGEDLAFVAHLAEELGYRTHECTDHALSLRHRKSGTYLELHTSLTSCPDYLGVDIESLLDRSIPTTHLPARTLAVEDHLLHLSLHGSFQHGLRQPAANACDAYLLSQHRELRWDRFFERASAPRLAPLVYGGLSLCHHLFPTEEIRDALDTLKPFVGRRHQRRAARLRTNSLLNPAPQSVFGSPWARIRWTPGPRDGLALAWKSLCTRSAGHPPNQWPSVRRGLTLLWRHGPPERVQRVFARTAAQAKPCPVDLTGVSIGDTSNV